MFCCEEERKLELNEKPLLVQLSWIKNNCEGRFVLRNIKTLPQVRASQPYALHDLLERCQ